MTADDETGHAQKISQFFQLVKRFDEDPSIENYVALRRFAPHGDTEIYRFAGVDPLCSLEPDLKKFGLDPVLVCGVLDGDDREMDELCLQLLERLIERKRLVAERMTHLQSGSDGATPVAGLIADNSGALYSTTGVGGTASLGTVFKLTLSP